MMHIFMWNYNFLALAIEHIKECHAGLDPASSFSSGFPGPRIAVQGRQAWE
jgi:hypothetical protein